MDLREYLSSFWFTIDLITMGATIFGRLISFCGDSPLPSCIGYYTDRAERAFGCAARNAGVVSCRDYVNVVLTRMDN